MTQIPPDREASDLVIMCKAYDNASNQRDASLARVRELETENARLRAENGTEAEQAVLLAMRGSSEPSLRGYAESTKGDWLGDACRAELARRGLR